MSTNSCWTPLAIYFILLSGKYCCISESIGNGCISESIGNDSLAHFYWSRKNSLNLLILRTCGENLINFFFLNNFQRAVCDIGCTFVKYSEVQLPQKKVKRYLGLKGYWVVVPVEGYLCGKVLGHVREKNVPFIPAQVWLCCVKLFTK